MVDKSLVLVYPPRIGTTRYTGDISAALLYLAGATRESNACDNISIFDFNIPIGAGRTIDDLLKSIESQSVSTRKSSISQGVSTIIAINCLYSGLFPVVRDIAAKVKARFTDIKVVVGGIHATLFAKEIIDNCPEFDAVAIGESDVDFPLLLRHLFYCIPSHDDLEGVCLRVNGKTVYKPRIRYVHDLDSLPRPGYEFYDLKQYSVDTSGWWSPDGINISSVQLPLVTSRSCPSKCNFCTNSIAMGDKFRARSAKSVFNEIQYLSDTYGVNYFRIEDDNLTLNRERIVSLCKMIIKSGLRVYFDARNGISLKTLDEEVVSLMRRAGFIMVSLAVESASDYIRNKVMGKHISREQILNAFEMCSSVGMNVAAFFIIGMPEDTEDTLKEMSQMIHEINAARIFVMEARPYPGTKLFEQCVKDNLLTVKSDNDFLWTGDVEYEYMKKAKRLIDREPRSIRIKPYKLSLERLLEINVEIQQIAYEKSRAWFEHVLKNNVSKTT